MEPASPSGSGWLTVGLQRGVALSVLYGLLWIAVAWVAARVAGSETDVVFLGFDLTPEQARGEIEQVGEQLFKNKEETDAEKKIREIEAIDGELSKAA